jgi:hypothetical protein
MKLVAMAGERSGGSADGAGERAAGGVSERVQRRDERGRTAGIGDNPPA